VGYSERNIKEQFQQSMMGYFFNPNYALGFVVACPDDYREEVKTQKNQAFSE